MKLSKVKKVCLDGGNIIVKIATTGLDISTWIGTQIALYPVRGMTMNTELAIRIWELESKKLKDMNILEDTEEEETETLISQEELERPDFLCETFEPEGEKEFPGLIRVATIDGYVLLTDRENKKGLMFREDKLGPVEGQILTFLPVEEGSNFIAVLRRRRTAGSDLRSAMEKKRNHETRLRKDRGDLQKRRKRRAAGMMNGYVVRRGDLYLAKSGTESSFYDARGNRWSREMQAARVFLNETAAIRSAKYVGGVVKEKKDGRVVEEG